MSYFPEAISRLFHSSERGREVVVLLAITLTVSAIIAGLSWLLQGPSRNVPLVLSTLAGAQAAFFGIVFAITILGIQLSTNRYSPRLVHLFIDGWPFKIAFSVFVVSIGFDLLLLSLVTTPPSRLIIAGVGAAGGLAIASAGILYWFVRTTLAQSTPEGLIRAIADELPPSTYFEQTQPGRRSDDLHPLHRLYSLVMAALSRGESETAFRGLETLGEITVGGLNEIQENDDSIEDRDLQYAFESVLEEFLPDIALHAHETEERRTGTQTVEILKELGEMGMDGETESITRYSSHGLGEIIKETPVVTEANVLRDSSAEALGDLLMIAGNGSETQTYRTLFSDLNHQLVVLLRRDAEVWVYQRILLHYFDRVLPNLLEALVEHHAEEVDDASINWHNPHAYGEDPPSDAANRFIEFHRRLGDITEGILYFTFRNNEYPYASGNFRRAWQRIATNAAKSSLPTYGVLITQTLVTTAYSVDRIEDGPVGAWALPVVNVMDDANPEVVAEAFERLEAGDFAENKLISVYFQPDDEERMSLIGRLLSERATDELTFEEWLPQFKERVGERYERLR